MTDTTRHLLCDETIDHDDICGESSWKMYTGHDVEVAINTLPDHHVRGVPKRFRGASRSSARQYWASRMHPVLYGAGFNAMANPRAELVVLNDHCRILAAIENRDIQTGGKKDALVAILAIDQVTTKATGKPGLRAEAIAAYRARMGEYARILSGERDTLYKEPLVITWDELMARKARVLAANPDSIAAAMAHLYLGDFPPTRYNFHDVGFYETTIAHVAATRSDRNCYATKDHAFYIGRHKTALDNGPIIIHVKPGLLRDYIERKMVPGAMWLFPGQKRGTHFTGGMWSRICNREFGGIDAIRRAYVTTFARGMSMTERKDLAKAMGNSVFTQQDYEYAPQGRDVVADVIGESDLSDYTSDAQSECTGAQGVQTVSVSEPQAEAVPDIPPAQSDVPVFQSAPEDLQFDESALDAYLATDDCAQTFAALDGFLSAP